MAQLALQQGLNLLSCHRTCNYGNVALLTLIKIQESTFIFYDDSFIMTKCIPCFEPPLNDQMLCLYTYILILLYNGIFSTNTCIYKSVKTYHMESGTSIMTHDSSRVHNLDSVCIFLFGSFQCKAWKMLTLIINLVKSQGFHCFTTFEKG